MTCAPAAPRAHRHAGNLIEGVDETNSNPNRHPALEALLEPGTPPLDAGEPSTR
jgi:hypothetical protein